MMCNRLLPENASNPSFSAMLQSIGIGLTVYNNFLGDSGRKSLPKVGPNKIASYLSGFSCRIE